MHDYTKSVLHEAGLRDGCATTRQWDARLLRNTHATVAQRLGFWGKLSETLRLLSGMVKLSGDEKGRQTMGKINLTIRLMKRGWDRPREVKVEGYASSTPGLAVHKMLDYYMQPVDYRWDVTHIASGWKVNHYSFPTRTMAERFAVAVGALADWTMGQEELPAFGQEGWKALIGEVLEVEDAIRNLGK